ncbi:MAG: DUF4249 domain-containing protein [Bacteroidetes bacterium]|nr:DUF4249 domain-containing protein [Bacteroidota bacterium]
MKNIFRILIAVISLSFFSCDDPVQIKLDEGSKLYVIDAFVNSLDTTQTIRITTSDSYFSNRLTPVVSNAQVVLKDLTDDVSYTFQYTGNGNYEFTPQDSIAKINRQYELSVTIDGYTYTSLTTQKRAAAIDSIFRLDMRQYSLSGNVNEDEYFFGMAAKDKVDENTDYYWIKTYKNDFSLFSSTGIVNSIDGTNGAVPYTEGIDSLPFTPPATFLGFTKHVKGDVCRVEIHSITRDTYYFFTQTGTQVSNGGLFATTPENVKTNIVTPSNAPVKAVGWFSMASVATKSKKAE